SWKFLDVCSKNELPTRARPLLQDQAFVMAGFAFADNDVALAAGALISFDGAWRPREAMVKLSQCTVDLDQGTCHIDLGFTSGGKRSGTPEYVIIDELECACLLARIYIQDGVAMLGGSPPSQRERKLIAQGKSHLRRLSRFSLGLPMAIKSTLVATVEWA
ncbi:unnamed protein product, partial [Prorocentrum cordatum]